MLSRFLFYVAGVDHDVLSNAPDSDKKYICQLGATLILSALTLFFISYGSVLGAGLATSKGQCLFLGAICALLSAIVISIDRSFIMADWFNSARDNVSAQAITTPPFHLARFLTVTFRLLLSAAIAFLFSVLAETFLYRDSIASVIDEEHYQANRPVYQRLESYRDAKNRELQNAQIGLADQQQKVEAFSPFVKNSPDKNMLPTYDTELRQLDALVTDKQKGLEHYKDIFRSESERAIGEEAGDKRPGLTGVRSCGTQCNAAKQRAEAASQTAQSLSYELASHESRRKELLAHINNTYQYQSALSELMRLEKEEASLQESYEKEITSRQDFLEQQPDFVPKSTGLARRFSALHVVYNRYNIWPEVVSLKLFIMLMEMAPILIKFLSTPKTQYAVRLNKNIDVGNFAAEAERLDAARTYLEKEFSYWEDKEDYTMRARHSNIVNADILRQQRAAG